MSEPSVYGADWNPSEEYHVPAGDTCPRCKRRVPHPKKPSTPKTVTRSYRVPVDEAEAHKVIEEQAAKHIGVFNQPYWGFKLQALAYGLVLQDEGLRGFAHRDAA